MAIEVSGGGVSAGSNGIVTRKVLVTTDGSPVPIPDGNGLLTSVNVTNEPGGIKRGIFEFTQGVSGTSATYAAGYNAYGKKIEFIGGSREVPIYSHPKLAVLTDEQIADVQKAVEEKKKKTFADPAQQSLYNLLTRQVEYYIAPSLVVRITEIESNLPSASELCKLGGVSSVDKPAETEWILTGLQATPLGDKYEVSREYTSIPDPTIAQWLYT